MSEGKERLAKLLEAKGKRERPPGPTAKSEPRQRPDPGPRGGTAPSQLILGDCREILRSFPAECFHAIITDPGVGASESFDGWENGAPGVEFWQSFMRVAKPGAWLAVFSGRKKDHWVKVYAEQAGWEYRDTLMWVYPKGMPMSIDVGQAVDKKMGGPATQYFRSIGAMTDEQREAFIAAAKDNPWYGWGTELRPTWEPIALLRKPFSRSVADNTIEHGTGPINIDRTRIPVEDERDAIATYIPPDQGDAHGMALTKYQQAVGKTSLGRWPADALWSHAEDCGRTCVPGCAVAALEEMAEGTAKFFYCPKASRAEKDMGLPHKANTMKGVKPEKVMQWLVDLLLPDGGALLDPFMGTGSTGIPIARQDGRYSRGSFVGIESEMGYMEIASTRLEEAKDRGPV